MPVKKAPARKSAATRQPSSADAVDAQLARYRSMRDFGVTAEPAGASHEGRPKAEKGTKHPFCIQKHAASHLHYDFRLGWNGVLKSWACAKGPSYNVKEKRLAIQVEDHPMEYGGFEGIIPKGQYGGGTVMLWDQGEWAPQAGYEDVDAGLRDGHVKFTLAGNKMHGKWALIRMKPRPKESKPAWLLIKEHDSYERGDDEPEVTETESNSVVTGRTMEEIAANRDHVWNSKATAGNDNGKGPQAWYRQDAAAESGKADGLPTEAQPMFLKPQLALETEAPPSGAGWLHELKLDGYRMQARKDGAKVQMLTRSGLDWTARMKPIAAQVAKLPAAQVTLDGEVVVVRADGTTSFADLQAAMQENARNPLTYFCFDLLHLNGCNTRGLPLIERKELLAELLAHGDQDHLQLSEHLTTNGVVFFRKACELHAEGVISKRADAVYTPTRASSWLKSKCLHEQEFAIGGYTLPGKGATGGPGVGSLLLGYYDERGSLLYAGRTGTGFTQKFSAELRKRLRPIEVAKCPFKFVGTEGRRGAIWVAPSMVAQVRFANWTADDQVRQAAFLGLREDKRASEVRREIGAPTPKSAESKRMAKTSVAVRSEVPVAPAGIPLPKIRLTHPEKVLDVATGLTKQQLADFYRAVAERMLPHVTGRALSLVRVPEGIGKEQFFQKHVTSMLPPGFDSVAVPDKKTGKVEQYISLSKVEAIFSLAQISVLEVHPWGSMANDLERPDRLVIDLDPDEALPWGTLTKAAEDVRQRLKKLGLESFVKTTGGKGLHVVIPIEPEHDWTTVKMFCHGFVTAMERANPSLYLTKMTKAARGGKIYLDYLRNERGATAVAPYSPRARANPGVAVPLPWSELAVESRPDFRIANFGEWRARLKKDPWAKMMTTRQALAVQDKQKS